MRGRLFTVGLLCAAAAGALLSGGGCRRDKKTAPEASRPATVAARPAIARPAGAPHLAWASDWRGAWPTVLASERGELAIAVFGEATMGALAIGTKGERALSLVRIGADHKPVPTARVAPGLAWAHPLALLDDGGLIADGAKPGGAAAEVTRTRPDGGIVWTQPLPADTHAGAIAADLAADTIALAVDAGARSVAPEGYFSIKSGSPQQREEIRAYDANGKLRFASRLTATRHVWTQPIAVRPPGGVLAGGHFSGDLRIEGDGAPPASASQPGTGDAVWIAAWDGGGRVVWLRRIEGGVASVRTIRPLDDGSVLAVGQSDGRLTNLGNVTDLSPVPAADAGRADAGAPNPKRQMTYYLRLDGATGAPLSVRYRDGAQEARPAGDGLIDVDTTRLRDGEDAVVTTVSESDAAGKERWRAEIDAGASSGVAVGRDAVLVTGNYGVVLSVPGRDPPAALIAARADQPFVGLLAWRPGEQVAAPAPAPARFTEVRDRAMRAFRAKRFREACDLFASAQIAQPADAANMADLALCLQRADDKDAAIRANRYAIRLAEAPGAAADKSLRVRKAAYFNLDKLQAVLRDAELVSGFGCTRPVYVSERSDTTGGIHYLADFTVKRFALEEEDAEFDEEDDKRSWPQLGAQLEETTDDAGGTAYEVTTDLQEDFRDTEGESQEWSGTGCNLVHADGCSGHLGFACEFFGEGKRRKSITRVIELTLTRPAPAVRD